MDFGRTAEELRCALTIAGIANTDLGYGLALPIVRE